MASQAHYYVSAVRYNLAQTHIEQLFVHQNNGTTFGTGGAWTRAQVISTIERGYVFMTIVQKNGGWQIGEHIRVVTVNWAKYLRTDGNNVPADNLGNLPRF